MHTILRWLAQLNRWYDNLVSKGKFAVDLIYGLFPYIILTTFSTLADEKIFSILGLIWILIFVVAYRAWWLYGNLEDYLY